MLPKNKDYGLKILRKEQVQEGRADAHFFSLKVEDTHRKDPLWTTRKETFLSPEMQRQS